MIDFDRLNRETREYNARNVDRFNRSAPNTNYNSAYWIDYNNAQTWKNNNYFNGGFKNEQL